jgi:hypothetical protein
MRMNGADRELDQPTPFSEMKIVSISAVGMENSVLLVAGLGEHSVAEQMWRATSGSTLVRHDLSGLADGSYTAGSTDCSPNCAWTTGTCRAPCGWA